MAMTPRRSGKTRSRRWTVLHKKIGQEYKTNVGLVQMRVTAPAGWGWRPQVDVAGPWPAPGARRLCRLDPSHPQFVTRHGLTLNQARTLLMVRWSLMM